MRPFGLRDAVVLSGGGAKGAYEVGVLKALIDGASPSTGGRALEPEIYTGTSVGAYNATYMASRPHRTAGEAIDELVEIWLRRVASTLRSCGNGVFRLRAPTFDPGCLVEPLRVALRLGEDTAHYTSVAAQTAIRLAVSKLPLQYRPLQALNMEAFFTELPLRNLIDQTIDLEGLADATTILTIATADWVRGDLRLFTGPEIATQAGTAAVLASSAVPGIFPPVVVEGRPLVDGGLLLNTPLKPAIADGAGTVHVVYLDPLLSETPPADDLSTLDQLYRAMAIIWAARINADLETAKRINQGLRLLDESRGLSGASSVRRAIAQLAEVERRLSRGQRPRYIEVHLYRPKVDLGGGVGLIDFGIGAIRRLIELGLEDARRHDCGAMGCLLVEDLQRDGRAPTRFPTSHAKNRPQEVTR